MRKAVQGCRGCDLYKNATQGVFGEGSTRARIVFVGEQPGDVEDRAGHPFVGPAGKILDRALAEAGIPRADAYVTNAVKHFKWRPMAGTGKRRLHQKPSMSEVRACAPWLAAELDLIRPTVLVAMGTTAAQSIFGRTVRIGEMRGRFFETASCPFTLVTIHPSAIRRIQEDELRHLEFGRFVADLKLAAEKLSPLSPL